MNEPGFFTIQEFAKIVKIHPSTVRRAIKCGKLQAVKFGASSRPLYRIPSSEINRIALFDLKEMIKKMVLEESEKALENQND
jgi:excisionase family DNA binding protein